ncbi:MULTISPECIES: hypothetical protein [Bacillus]|uniref:hypothetical protein n=1 Tax=Bacillus TaxID=1386 RepID=UPI0006A84045|nr:MULTISPECIES: hypothetical protein [Bacillus]MDY7905252.1 hypothetical protein [Bacillus sp. AG1]QWK24568.1 hypothetical protein KM776_17025 [Bacillus velezensis]WGS37458.1 hypothetical protein PO845_16040 [Bacillus velezensis]CUB45534.1 hypothetical protein BN2127_JRS8_03379 [Bacillus amyloliquefaciens]
MKEEKCNQCKKKEQGKFRGMRMIGKWTYRIIAGFKTLSWFYGWIATVVWPFFHHLN